MNVLRTAFCLLLACALTASAQGPTAMKNPPKLTITIVVEEAPLKRDPSIMIRTVTGSGEAEYPNGTALQFGIRLKDDTKVIGRTQGFVTDKRWEIALQPFGKDIYHGVYVCQVDFDPELQAPGIVPKLPADKRQRHSTTAEQKLGTDAEIAEERAEVTGYYRQVQGKIKTVYETVSAEYQRQLTEKDAAAWSKVVAASTETLQALDADLVQFRKKRINVMMAKSVDSLGSAILTLRDYLMDCYSMAIQNNGKPAMGMDPKQHEESVKTLLERVDTLLAGGGDK
ncbi:MAG: hypothetical protein HUU15_03840 [Candidatus Brocadiae bacterium]|nr:hypothetical protein [Candidatus Brocadiia bacterium]